VQKHLRRRPDTQDLVRGYRARFGDAATPESDEEMREALSWDEMMDGFKHDERMSAVPDNFHLYEHAENRDERIRRTRSGLAALLRGDPEEHRESWELLKAELGGDETWSAVGSTSTT
jgi:hypothetical protein